MAGRSKNPRGSASHRTENVDEAEQAITSDGLSVVRDKTSVKDLESLLLSSERLTPIIGLSRSRETDEPVLAYTDVLAIVGPRVPVYLVLGMQQHTSLQRTLTRKLALASGAARIWWPGLSRRSDSRDHPMILSLGGEDEDGMILEFARQWDLSRPHVRREMKLLDGALSLAEHDLDVALEEQGSLAQQLRDVQIAHHEALKVATAAELRLEVALRRCGRSHQSSRGQERSKRPQSGSR